MLLHLLVLAPFVAAILMVATSKEDPKSSSRMAFLFGIAFVVMSVALLVTGNQSTNPMEWFKLPGAKGPVYYFLYNGSFSGWMVLLSTVLSLVALVSARNTTCKNYRNFAIGIFALMGSMNGTFLAGDAVLFFFFFEAMVIPAAILIAAYGGKEKAKAAMTFAIYTLVGSAPMMVALWYMLTISDNALPISLASAFHTMDPSLQMTIVVSFLLAFLVKTPIFPFHGWQAISYAEAPAPLSAILTGAMSKAGVFGMLYWVILIFPERTMDIANVMVVLGLVTALYGALMALRAKDAKKLLAFSSMGHLGLAVAGLFTITDTMFPAVLILLVAHGLSAGAQFFLMGIAERYTGTRELDKMGALASKTPVFGTLFGFVAVMALAVPGTAGFIGEFNVLISLWLVGPIPAVVAGICIILSAAYMLRFVQKVIFGKAQSEYVEGARMTALEGSSIAALATLLLVFGVHPSFVTDNSYNLLSEETIEKMKTPTEVVKEETKEDAPAAEAAKADADVAFAAAEEEKIEEVAQPMTEDDFKQLDENLKANGFSDEERASLIAQLKAMNESENAPEANAQEGGNE